MYTLFLQSRGLRLRQLSSNLVKLRKKRSRYEGKNRGREGFRENTMRFVLLVTRIPQRHQSRIVDERKL